MGQAKEIVLAKPMTGKIRFEYIKSNFFRVIHVDGVHGGIRPSGTSLRMTLFSERQPIPKSEEYEVTEGKLGKRSNIESRSGLIREAEIDAIMDLNTARAIRDWLDRHLAASEAMGKEMPKKEGK